MKQSVIKKHLIILSIIPFMLGNNVKAEEQNNIEEQSIGQIQHNPEQQIINKNVQQSEQYVQDINQVTQVSEDKTQLAQPQNKVPDMPIQLNDSAPVEQLVVQQLQPGTQVVLNQGSDNVQQVDVVNNPIITNQQVGMQPDSNLGQSSQLPNQDVVVQQNIPTNMQIMPSAQGVNEHNTVGLSKSMSLPVSDYKLNEMEQGLESVKRDQAEQRQRLQQLEVRIHEIDKSTKAVSNDIKENSKKDDLQEKAKDIFEQLNNEKVSKEDKLQLLKQYPGIVTIMGNNAYIYINEGKQFPLNIKDVIFTEVQANDIIKQLNDTNNSNIKETRKELLDKYPQIAQTLGLTTPEQINQYIEGTIQFPSDLNKAFANRAVTDYMVAKLNDSTVPVEEKTKLLASHPEISQTLGITKQEDLNKYFQEGNKLPDNFASTLSNKLMEKANTKKNKRSIVGVDGADIDRMFNQAAELPPTPPSIPVAPYVPAPVQTLTSPIVQTKTNVKPIDKSKINELKANNKTGTITDTEQYVVDNYLNNPNLTQEQKREILSNYPKIVEIIGKENVEYYLQNNIPFPPVKVPSAVSSILELSSEVTNTTETPVSREQEIETIIKNLKKAPTKAEQVNIVKDYPQLQKLVLDSIKNNKPININDIRQKLINDKGWNPALLDTEDLLKSSTKRAQLSLDNLEDAMLNAKTREQRSNILKLHPELKTLPGITSYLNTGRVPDLSPLQQRVVEQAHKKEPFGLEKLTEQDKSKQYKDDITLNKSNALHLDNDEAVNKWHTYNQLTKAELIKRLDNCEKTCKLLSSKIPVESSNNLTNANIPTANNVQDTSDYTTWIKNAAGSLTKNEKFMNLINSKKDADANNNGILTQQPDNNSQALVLYKQPLSEQFANQQVTNLVNKPGNISKEVEQNTIPVAPEVPVLNNTIKEEIKNISAAEMEQNQGVSNDQPALEIVDDNTVNSKQDAYKKLVHSMAKSNDLKINNNVQLALTNAQDKDQPVLVDNSVQSTTTVPTQLIGNNDAPVNSETKNISNTSNEEQGQVITKPAQQEIKSDVPETNNQNLEQKQTTNEQTQPVSATTLNTATTDDQDEDTIGNAMNKMFENAAKLPQTPPSAPTDPAKVPTLNDEEDVINYLNNPNIPAEKKQGILKSYPDLAKQFSLESNSLVNNDIANVDQNQQILNAATDSNEGKAYNTLVQNMATATTEDKNNILQLNNNNTVINDSNAQPEQNLVQNEQPVVSTDQTNNTNPANPEAEKIIAPSVNQVTEQVHNNQGELIPEPINQNNAVLTETNEQVLQDSNQTANTEEQQPQPIPGDAHPIEKNSIPDQQEMKNGGQEPAAEDVQLTEGNNIQRDTTEPTQVVENKDEPINAEKQNINNTANEEQGQVITKSAQQEIKSDVPETNNQNLEQSQSINEQARPVPATTLNTATTDDQDEDTIGNAMNKMFENAAKLPQTPPSAPIPPAAPAKVPTLNDEEDVIKYLNNPNIPAEKKQGILKSYPDLAKQFSLESNSLGNNDKVSGNINEIDAANNNQQGENIDNSSVNEAKQHAAAAQILSEIEESSEDVANINTDLSKSDKDKLKQIKTVIEGFNSSKAE